MSIVTLVNYVLGIVSAFIEWGQSRKLFKANEAIIALHILKKTQEDIKIAIQVENNVLTRAAADPNSVLLDTEFHRD